MKRYKIVFLAVCLIFAGLFQGCSGDIGAEGTREVQRAERQKESVITLDTLPAYAGVPYVEINGNKPQFSEEDYTKEAFEQYSELDQLGRCGVAYANICEEIMPKEERGAIGQIKPSGWHTVKYDCVDGKYLYNRCHLIGYQLAGENANEKNLITGARYMNVAGMLPFEDKVADFVQATGYHVLYRVTPVYRGNNLVADGVEMEAFSVEDKGAGISFYVFVYNVQPQITIDYADGSSYLSGENVFEVSRETEIPECVYILNKNTMKFHKADCPSVQDMSKRNMVKYNGERNDVIQMGYEACKRCNP